MSGLPEFVWFWDGNNRHYERDAKGVARGGPIWRKSWRKVGICGANSRSYELSQSVWLGGRDVKRVPKAGSDPTYWAWSEDDINAAEWVYSHRYKVAGLVQQCKDANALKQIAELLGYKP
jgi:hypothetical protein